MLEENSYIPKVKICGNFREEDIVAINHSKPDYCGFVIDYPKSYRSLSMDKAHQLRRSLLDEIQSVAVFVNKPFMEVAEFMKEADFDIAQLHGDEEEGYIDVLKAEIPEKEVWKVFKIKPEATEEEVKKILYRAERSLADMILFDSGYGQGKVFNYKYLKDFKRPYILAGGLNIKNMTDAMKEVHPYMLDVSSGVETDGFKDESKMLDFIFIAKSGIGGPINGSK